MDDDTTRSTTGAEHDRALTDEDRLERRLGNGPLDVDQRTFRSKRNRENDYLGSPRAEDRDLHGIDGINAGPRGPGEHGARRRPQPRALGPADGP